MLINIARDIVEPHLLQRIDAPLLVEPYQYRPEVEEYYRRKFFVFIEH